jgi:hypothetical protein
MSLANIQMYGFVGIFCDFVHVQKQMQKDASSMTLSKRFEDT